MLCGSYAVTDCISLIQVTVGTTGVVVVVSGVVVVVEEVPANSVSTRVFTASSGSVMPAVRKFRLKSKVNTVSSDA
jgi:hypothetical protein